MKQYLVSVWHGDGDGPPGAEMEQIVNDVEAVNAEIRAAGAWVFAGGLFPSTTATVLRARDDEVLVTDGPYIEGKEHIGGFWVIKAEDLDEALNWGRKAARACRIPVEVRPFRDEP